MLRTSQTGIDLIKEFEGYRSQAYLDAVGIPTIGYGTTRIKGVPVQMGMSCTKTEAEEWLRDDLDVFEENVNRMVQVPINQNQFDALVSFAYNCGWQALEKSTLLRKLNSEDYVGARDQFQRWNKAGGRVLAGLTRRRNAESVLFDTPVKTVPTQHEDVYVDEVEENKPTGSPWAAFFSSILQLFK